MAASTALDQLRCELCEAIQPEGCLETAAFETFLRARSNLLLLDRLQNEANAPSLDRILRLQARLEQSAARALAELRRLQTDATLRMKLDAEPEERLPPLTSGPANFKPPEVLRHECAAARRAYLNAPQDIFEAHDVQLRAQAEIAWQQYQQRKK